MRKVLILIGMISLASINVNAQLTNTSNEYHSANDTDGDIEYATKGSVMPYKVSPFNWGSLAEQMQPSMFKWWLNGNATGYKLLRADGITPLTALPPPNNVYYPDSIIAIRWIKSGKYNIRVSEKTMPKNDVLLCDQAESFRTLDVIVTERPRVAWENSSPMEGCNLQATTQNIQLRLQGVESITISYSIVFTSIDGNTSDSLLEERAFLPPLKENEFYDSLPVDIPSGKYGTYQVYIRDIKDKVSQKCGIDASAGDFPAEPYILKVFPIAEPGPIRMIKVLK